MSTSGPNAPADDDDDAATVDADERNDNEAARDAAATALWTRCLEHAGTSPRDPKIPTHVAVLKDIHGADYSTLLKCPLDDRTEHPYGQKGERTLAATGALARCRIEFFASDYTGLFRQGTRTGLIRFSTAVAPPTGAASLVLGKAKHSKLFPLVAIKCMRANGPSGNLLFARCRVAIKNPQYAIDATHRLLLAGGGEDGPSGTRLLRPRPLHAAHAEGADGGAARAESLREVFEVSPCVGAVRVRLARRGRLRFIGRLRRAGRDVPVGLASAPAREHAASP